ncbi:lipopolysaccharide kinase InaA family protein, partial [Pseudomonas aeruginosa]|uniref:lipopolysaccharide kinase InaA family protein n=1 Tax=Pseudomonas aeruginosa TaxID=287 RepID=UPI0031B7198F
LSFSAASRFACSAASRLACSAATQGMAVSAKYDEFNHWWATEGDWVEEPNYRRNGMSGVQCVERNGKKLYVKRMTHHLFHSVRYPFGRPTIVREVAVIKELE